MHISKLLATIAPTAPGAVEFHIHHVVPAFQINRAIKANNKKRFVFVSFSAIKNSGTQARNIRKVSGESGHARNNKRPVRTDRTGDDKFFNKDVL